MPDEISRDDILARLRALPADDPLQAAAHRMEALLDQMEARGLELMRHAKTFNEGLALVAKARQARGASKDNLARWIEGADIPAELVEQFWEMLDALEGGEG